MKSVLRNLVELGTIGPVYRLNVSEVVELERKVHEAFAGHDDSLLTISVRQVGILFMAATTTATAFAPGVKEKLLETPCHEESEHLSR